jgi:Ser/Thr protein kinase RdoA (MazF antagonist)
MYDPLTIKQLTEALKKTIPEWGWPAETDISLIAVSENATFLAFNKKTNRKKILRVHAKNYHSKPEIESEIAWIYALREAKIIETPKPIKTTSGEAVITINDGFSDRYVAAFEFMEGEEPKVGAHLSDWFYTLGETTAKLHNHAKTWNRPSWFTRKVWNLENSIGPDGLWGDWKNAMHLKDEGKEIISEAISVIKSRLELYGSSTDRFGLVHADLRLANLLVADSLKVIDFDDCGFSWFAYDFASAISFHELDPSIPDLQEAWIRGYRTVSEFTKDDEKELPTFILLRRIMLTAWLASHSHAAESNELGSAYTDGTVELARIFLKNQF